jgi:transcription-repair coupling factor (superfamily II helicase)
VADSGFNRGNHVSSEIINTLLPAWTLKPTQHQAWGNLQGSSPALVISQLAQLRPVLVVTADTRIAEQLHEEIEFFAKKTCPLSTLPSWETLPYDTFSPHQAIVSERLATLYQLPELTKGVIIFPITTLMHYVPPTHYVRANSLFLRSGQRLHLEQFRQQLEQSGYRCMSQVMEHGEFAVRGGLLDLFPMGSEQPYRIDLLDEEIDSIRYFDPETQRSQGIITEIRLLPAREFPLDTNAITQFRQQWRSHFPGDPTRSPIYREMSEGFVSAGIEYYIPLFFEQMQTLFDYLPEDSVVVTLENVLETAEQFWQEVNSRYEQLRHDIERPLLPPTELFLQANQVFAGFRRYPQLHFICGNDHWLSGAIRMATSEIPYSVRCARSCHCE